MGQALSENKKEFAKYTDAELRRQDKYEIHSIDNIKKYIRITEKEIPKHLAVNGICKFHYSQVEMGEFGGRICTYYSKMPNVCPDLIYLDGPNQFSPKGNIRGFQQTYPDRMPMAADILAIEHYLQPGTLIVVDGRTANARFLKTNLQRNWAYFYNEKWDQHYLELQEMPLGVYNKKMLEFCLGSDYFERISK